jgi:mannose-6-phosphate isomerase-like protein (cupin superfamily)
MARYSTVHVDDLEGEDPNTRVRKARQALGARAFGVNLFRLPPDVEGREHDHADSNQEEVYFVLAGSGVMRVDGDEVELRPGLFVRVDPAATRVPIAGADGLEYVVVGAPLDGRYEPPSWG